MPKANQTTALAHTPGPWSVSVEKSHDGPGNVLYVIGPSYRRPGDERIHLGLPVVQVHGTNDWDHAMANARLIAAAPDFMHACKKLVASYKNIELEIPMVMHIGLGLIEDAIAKAEGRS